MERPARGRKPIFRRESVIDTALALVDEQGHEALSMRAIAAQLGAGVATLYHYFGSLAELKDAMAIALLNDIPLLDATNAAETRRQLKRMAMAYADVVARHPDFELMVGPKADQQIMRLLDSALRAMRNAGVDIERAGVSWSLLQSLAQTHAASSRRLNNARHTETRKRFKELDAVLALANTGAFKASHDEWFERILDLTIDRMLPELNIRSGKR
jgi:AcrR family transcriptional regulator